MLVKALRLHFTGDMEVFMYSKLIETYHSCETFKETRRNYLSAGSKLSFDEEKGVKHIEVLEKLVFQTWVA